MNKINIAIAGLGTVGSEVAKQLQINNEFLSKKAGIKLNLIAVSAKDKSKNRGFDQSKLNWFEDATDIASSNEVDLVVELIGGSDGVPLELCKNSLINGKSVVTANKAMMSKHGYDLAKLSENNDCSLAFEASVAGCIPIIKSLRDGLSGTKVNKITGILNGTCNYILTEMNEKGLNFDEVLKDAQDKGYAEADPSFDVNGMDCAHKISIISMISFGNTLNSDHVYVEGIENIEIEDIIYSDTIGYKIKLLGITEKLNNKILRDSLFNKSHTLIEARHFEFRHVSSASVERHRKPCSPARK